MFRKFVFSIILTIGIYSSWFSMDVGPYGVPDSLLVGNEKLILNGAGIREKFFIAKDIYVAALYLKELSHEAKTIIHSDETMAIRLEIVTSLVTPKKFTESTKIGFEEATSGNTAPIKDKIDQFLSVFKNGINKGDIYLIQYVKNSGIQVFKNKDKTSQIKLQGMDIKTALFGIWLGPRSEDKVQVLTKKLLQLP